MLAALSVVLFGTPPLLAQPPEPTHPAEPPGTQPQDPTGQAQAHDPTGQPQDPTGQDPTGQLSNVDVEDLAAMSLEELLDVKVVTATKTAQTLAEAPAIISVITKSTFCSKACSTSASENGSP